jgi:hypothetical protein
MKVYIILANFRTQWKKAGICYDVLCLVMQLFLTPQAK